MRDDYCCDIFNKHPSHVSLLCCFRRTCKSLPDYKQLNQVSTLFTSSLLLHNRLARYVNLMRAKHSSPSKTFVRFAHLKQTIKHMIARGGIFSHVVELVWNMKMFEQIYASLKGKYFQNLSHLMCRLTPSYPTDSTP